VYIGPYLVGETLVLTFQIEGIPYEVLNETKNNLQVNVGDVSVEVGGYDDQIINFTAEVTLTKPGETFNVTAGDFVLVSIDPNAVNIVFDAYPYNTDGTYNSSISAVTAGTQRTLEASIFVNGSYSLPYYEVLIELPEGWKINGTSTNTNFGTKENVDLREDNTTIIYIPTDPADISFEVMIPKDASGTYYVTVTLNGSNVKYSWPLVYVLPANTQADITASLKEVYLGVDDLELTFVVTNQTAKTYSITISNGKEEIELDSGSVAEIGIPQSWTFETSDLSQWVEWEPDTYTILVHFYNETNDEIANASVEVTFKDEIAIKEVASVYGLDTIYPGDDIFINVTVTHDGNYNVTILETGFTNESVPVTAFDPKTKTGYLAYNLSDIFTGFNLANGTYTLVVSDGIVNAIKNFTVSKHKVILSEESATIPLGTSYKIQVTTTANITDLTINPSAGITPKVAVDKPFNSTTHLQVFNVTFTTNGTAKLGENVVNITVPNGEVAQFTLNLTDELTPVYVPTKAVLGSKMFISVKTTANLSQSDYEVIVWAFGVSKTPVNLDVSLEPYNATKGYRLINMSFVVDNNIYSKDPENYPTHYMNITDGHKWIEKTFTIVKDPELYLEPVDTVIIGQNITFEGTTLLAPGEEVNYTIALLNQSNLSQVLDSKSGKAIVKLDTTGDENTFSFWHKFEKPGLYNVTVNWTTYKYTIQVKVLSEGVITLETDRDEYYPEGKIHITGELDNVTNDKVTLNFYWLGGSNTTTADLVNGTYEYYFDMSKLPANYEGDLKIEVSYNNVANATKTVKIVKTPVIENVAVPSEPVKAGTLFNITADTNLGINGTVTLTIVKADNATDVKVDGESLQVGKLGKLVYTVNTTKWTAGYYNVTLSKGTVKVEKQFYVYVVGANVSIVEDSLVVEPTEGYAPLTITVKANVTNTGDLDGEYTAVLKINNEEVANKTVEVPIGKTVTVEFNYTFETEGLYNVTIDGLTPVTVNVTEKPYIAVGEYDEKVNAAEHVYVVYGADALSADSFAISAYMAKTIPSDKLMMRLDTQVNLSALTENDVVVAVGGPAVNEVTAAYQDVAHVYMELGENITIVTPEGNLTWSAPEVWYNVTEGYFIIELFEDNETGALVVTIYGTDADSTMAGAYYFANVIYPNLDDYNDISWIVGSWQDTDSGEPVLILDPADDSGFNPTDTIEVVYMG